jgi:hypothetical protein
VDDYLGLANRNAERQTKARAAAVSYKRNLVAFAGVNHYMCSVAPNNLFVNCDATTIEEGGD